MIAVRIKHLRRVRSKGKTYWYHRLTGERLPDDENERLRRVLEINMETEAPSRRVKVGSVEALANVYRASGAFKQLADSTQHNYATRLRQICDLWGDFPIASIQRKHVIAMQDRHADTPATADRLVMVLRVLLAFAMDREYRADNPAKGVKKLRRPRDVEGHTPWPDWATDKFLTAHDGAVMGLAAALGLYTGQRKGDVLRMRWSDITAGRISVRQGKTGTRLEIPLHSQLAAVLAQHKPRSPMILTTGRGRPFTGSNFRNHFRKAIEAAGLQDLGLSFHGLRYAAADQLAELGCSLKEIASITGHKSLAMLAKYTAGADQRRLSGAAIERWDKHSKNAKVENHPDGSGKSDAKRLKDGGF